MGLNDEILDFEGKSHIRTTRLLTMTQNKWMRVMKNNNIFKMTLHVTNMFKIFADTVQII